ncbi:hypothetical protein [Flavobacterium kingsejongi]|uniref:Thioredoxin-like fold domain-containing protein n=1 Tax=Flavobacterium kingsejongi TaxID=1678728 RepID=A0A2S1LR40_9FLAO|nr:hypothetical protein [Flavobacterium kingsejongi]AWG26227.1 hypothetical protein FK004_13810 [Flavobacterium kingsejongi]
MLSFTILWLNYKHLLLKQKDHIKFQIKTNRLIRNYEVFSKALFFNEALSLYPSEIIIGNKTTKIELSIITNPFCSHCKVLHQSLIEILDRNRDKLHLNFIINVDLNIEKAPLQDFYKVLLNTYFKQGEKGFREILEVLHKEKERDLQECLLNQMMKRLV